jgi:hypothetical protein
MATWENVRRLALDLPETDERLSRERLQWRVRGKLFVWQRPLTKRELAELGDDAPSGPILGARVEDQATKAALLASEPGVFFTTSHFDGYPAVLVLLEAITAAELREIVIEAWLARAPPRLAAEYVAKHF